MEKLKHSPTNQINRFKRLDRTVEEVIPNAISMDQLKILLLQRLKDKTPSVIIPYQIPAHHQNKLKTLRERQPQMANSAS